MGWFKRLIGMEEEKKSKKRATPSSNTFRDNVKKSFSNLKKENSERDKNIKKLSNHITYVKGKLTNLNKNISGFEKNFLEINEAVKKYDERFVSLEEKIGSFEKLSEKESIKTPINRLTAINRPINRPPKENNINTEVLNPKEQQILITLFDNKGMSLGYQDMAQLLNKSPNTIKAQIRAIKNKTNLLVEVTDKENKKRYKLRENIKLKKFLS